ncbi:MAG: histidine kinase [Nocardiopsaceae bacterium]|nr:histidine kinase [Nocardiopsaceae bacterium]
MTGAAAVTAALSVAATVAVGLLPSLRTASGRPSVQAALATAVTLTGLLTAVLVAGRLRRRRLLSELLLAAALVVLAVSSLLFETVPPLTGLARTEQVLPAIAGSVLGALLFVLAAFAPGSRLTRPGPVTAGAAAALAVAALGAFLMRAQAAGRLPQLLPGPAAGGPGARGLPLLPGAELLLAVAYGLAGAGFLARYHRLGDEFAGWLSVAAVVSAGSHVSGFLYPVLAARPGYVSDAFRLLFYAAALTGAVREIWSYWHALPAAAVRAERRRIGHDLHDGMAQELAYLARHLDSLAGGADAEAVGRLRRAVARAQRESRQAIRALAPPRVEALETALREAAAGIADRFSIEVRAGIDHDVRLPAAGAEALLRAAREAMTNAARHSGAGTVFVTLRRERRHVRLRVSDAGCGFDAQAGRGGCGLALLREGVRAAGGELRIRSLPGSGTEVEVIL